MEKKGALSGDEGNAVDDTEGGDMEQGEDRGGLPPSAAEVTWKDVVKANLG